MPAEEAHKQKIADNYRKLRFENVEAYHAAREGDPVADFHAVSAPAVKESAATPEAPSAAERIAQYRPIAAPASNHDLFGEYTYKDGVLYAPQQEETAEPVLTVAPNAPAIDEDDVVPTRRTMDTLNRPAAKVAAEETVKTGILSMLSTKTKAALAAVLAAIVIALVIIGINTGIIRSINSNIAMKQSELAELTRATQAVQEQIADLTSPESIAEWAAKHDMVLDR